MTALEHYAELERLSAAMLDSARANDWDALERQEQDMARTRESLQRLEPIGTALDGITEAERQTRMQIISRILENEREVREHVAPLLDSTRKLLSGAVKDRHVRAAYGSLAP